jgi:hypothetical protein
LVLPWANDFKPALRTGRMAGLRMPHRGTETMPTGSFGPLAAAVGSSANSQAMRIDYPRLAL